MGEGEGWVASDSTRGGGWSQGLAGWVTLPARLRGFERVGDT
jgi:hypothetical protein